MDKNRKDVVMRTFLIQKTMLIAFLAFSNVSVWAQIQKSLVGFQDLAWGTKINQVKSKLPNAKIIDVCYNDKELKKSSIQANKSCTELTQDYPVDGVSFINNFIFDASDRLKRVELFRLETNHQNPNYSDDTCHQLFKRLEYLLDSRYGASLDVSNQEPRTFWSRSEYRAWLPLPTEIFIAKSFDNKHPVYDARRDPSRKSCEVLINYSPRVSTEAKKL